MWIHHEILPCEDIPIGYEYKIGRIITGFSTNNKRILLCSNNNSRPYANNANDYDVHPSWANKCDVCLYRGGM